MKVTEYHSHFRADCNECGEHLIFARGEMAAVIDTLFKGKAIVDFTLTCPCQIPAAEEELEDA